MKNFKKLFAVLAAFMMVLTLGATAVKADGSIEITDETAGDHTYTAYQIVAGDVSKDTDGNVVYANPQWGSAVTPDTDGKVEIGGTKYTVAEFLTAFQNVTDKSAEANDLAEALEAVATKNGTVSVNGKMSDLKNGYYFVKETAFTNSTTEAGAMTDYLLLNVCDEDLTPTAKSDAPSSDKSVKDVNDSEDAVDGVNPTTWQKTADHDIGDEIDYELKATLPSNVTNFKKYFVNFVDDMSAGLQYVEDSAVLKVNGTEVAKINLVQDKTATSSYAGGKVYRYEIADVKAAPLNAGNNAVITIEYKAKLTGEAVVIGNPGNPNKSHIEYATNPNDNGGGTPGTTPDKECVVFTYKVVIDKTDGTNPLPNAGFTLQKWDAATSAWIDVEEIKASAETTFSFEGLDDGKYKLIESEVPTNYNKMEDVEFEVSADHGTTITSLNGVEVNQNGSAPVTLTFTADKDAGSLTSEVVNQKGTTLPETGGIGTTIFYTVGGLLVLGAIIMLIQKRRMAE